MVKRNYVKKFQAILFISFLIFAGCSSSPQVIVDQSGLSAVEKARLTIDKDECIGIARTDDLDGETAGKAIAGAAIGIGGSVIAGVATAVAGAVFPLAIPFIIAGKLAGGGIWGSKVSKKEAIARQAILDSCMEKRGHEVYSAN
jgi:hypothetical protein